MRLLGSLFSLLIIDLSVNSYLWLVFAPFSNKKLILVMIKVTALTLTLTVDPVAFEMITVSLGEHTITVALSLVPLALVDVFITVDHTPLPLRMSVDPVAVVAISICVEESTTTMAAVFVPVTSVLTTELPIVISPESALAVLFIDSPHAFIFIAVLVVLDAEALLAIVTPVSYIPRGAFPLFTLYSAIFLLVLLLDPVN